MPTIFVDSNVFLRFLIGDDPIQRKQSAALFTNAKDGDIRLIVGPPVLFEVAWTLRTAYGMDSDRILEFLSAILSFPGLNVLDAEIAGEAIRLARSCRQGFADAYIAASANRSGAESIATFNLKHFEKVDVPTYKFTGQ